MADNPVNVYGDDPQGTWKRGVARAGERKRERFAFGLAGLGASSVAALRSALSQSARACGLR